MPSRDILVSEVTIDVAINALCCTS